jgi:phage tail protein X
MNGPACACCEEKVQKLQADKVDLIENRSYLRRLLVVSAIVQAGVYLAAVLSGDPYRYDYILHGLLLGLMPMIASYIWKELERLSEQIEERKRLRKAAKGE